MDKRILDEQELQQLKSFIRSRGFKDEGTMLEILDHFACKVEDILTAAPDMSLGDAIVKAHRSFGVMGFRNIAAAYEVHLKKKYKKIFWRSVKDIVLHPGYCLLLVLTGWLSFKGYEWLSLNDIPAFAGIFEVSGLIFLLLVSVPYLLILKELPKGFRDNLIFQAALAPTGVHWFPIYFVLIGGDAPPSSPTRLFVSGLIVSFAVAWELLCYMARRQTIRKARQDYQTIHAFE